MIKLYKIYLLLFCVCQIPPKFCLTILITGNIAIYSTRIFHIHILLFSFGSVVSRGGTAFWTVDKYRFYQAATTRFNRTPSLIVKGGNSVLSWDVDKGCRLKIDQKDVTGTASYAVSPDKYSTYTLSVTNAYGSVTKASDCLG